MVEPIAINEMVVLFIVRIEAGSDRDLSLCRISLGSQGWLKTYLLIFLLLRVISTSLLIFTLQLR
jgi:hypothetical protein